MKKTQIISLFVILASFVIGIYYYSQMPDLMASHWNTKGEVNDYMSKFWGLFLMPIFALGIFLLFLVIPKIDPLKENIKKFEKYFDGFVLLFILFFFYIYALSILWNLGIRFDMGCSILPAMGILFYYVGVLLKNAKRNWFVGIKTPWTLSSDVVWDKTHKIGAKLFKLAGAIALLGIFAGENAIFFILVPVICAAIYTCAYSYFEYQKEIR